MVQFSLPYNKAVRADIYFPTRFSLLPLRWRQQDPTKCRYPSTNVQGIVSQNTVISIVTDVRASKLGISWSLLDHVKMSVRLILRLLPWVRFVLYFLSNFISAQLKLKQVGAVVRLLDQKSTKLSHKWSSWSKNTLFSGKNNLPILSYRISGARPLLLLYAFEAWTGTTFVMQWASQLNNNFCICLVRMLLQITLI
jgi:hypothetical protein